MAIRIITDSTADMPASVKEKVTVVPLTVSFGGKQYRDGVDIDGPTFYEMLIESDTLPVTSQAAPQAFLDEYEPILAQGDQILVITISSALSGTYQSACIAAAEYETGLIYPVDSITASIGTGILVELALALVERGLPIEEIVSILEEEKKHVRVIALVDTLEYMRKGGRISGAVAVAGNLLSLKPCLCIENGRIQLLGKARGSKQGNNLLEKHIQSGGGVDFLKPVLLGYTGLDDHMLQKYVRDSHLLWEEHCTLRDACMLGSVIGTHAGPGAIAVAYFSNNDALYSS